MLKRLSIISVMLTAIFWISACSKSDKKNESSATGDMVEMAVAPEAPMDPATAPVDMPAPPTDPAAPHAGCPHHQDMAVTGAGGCGGDMAGGCTMCEGCKDGDMAGGCANCPGCKDGCDKCEGCKDGAKAGGCANCPGCSGKPAVPPTPAPATK